MYKPTFIYIPIDKYIPISPYVNVYLYISLHIYLYKCVSLYIILGRDAIAYCSASQVAWWTVKCYADYHTEPPT